MPRLPPSRTGSLARSTRLLAFGVAGSAVLALSVTAVTGAAYIWFMVGLSPIEQLREGIGVALVGWPIGALFALLQLAGAFLEEPHGRWAIAGVTACLALLWLMAASRSRELRSVVHGWRTQARGEWRGRRGPGR